MKTYRFLELFARPLPPERVRLREVPARRPPQLERRVRRSWEREVRRHARRLGPGYAVGPHQDGWPAVYRGGVPVLWPGRVYALRSYALGRVLAFNLIPANFAWVCARGLPFRIFGIVTYAITRDGKIVLTRRGPRANIAPDRLHGNGGNPDRIEPVEEHQIRETEEEIAVRREEIVPGSMRFGGLSETLVYPRRKPNLCGWLRVALSAREIARRVRARPRRERPADAEDVEFVDLDPAAIDALLGRRRIPVCASGAAGLVVLRRHLLES